MAWKAWRVLGTLGIVAFFGMFLVGGVAIIVGGARVLDEATVLAERGRSITGTVLEARTRVTQDSNGGSTTHHEVLIEFVTPFEERQRFWANGRDAPGMAVEVVYDPQNPALATRHGAQGHRVGGIAIIVFGVVFTAMAAAFLVGALVAFYT